MLKTRMVTVVIGIPVVIFLLYEGGFYWDGFFGVVGVLGLYEFYGMMVTNAFRPVYVPGYCLFFSLLYAGKFPHFLPLILFIDVVLFVVYAVFSYPRVNINDISLTVTAAVYLGWTLHFAEVISTMTDAFSIIMLVLLLTWISDMGGYFCGSIWGRNKMAPALSPHKTWEGAVGATVFPIAAALCCALFLPSWHIRMFPILLLGLVAGIFAQFGDLFMSTIKRFFNTKDSGYIIPGHGGILDRFDSFFMVVPVVYYFFINIL